MSKKKFTHENWVEIKKNIEDIMNDGDGLYTAVVYAPSKDSNINDNINHIISMIKQFNGHNSTLVVRSRDLVNSANLALEFSKELVIAALQASDPPLLGKTLAGLSKASESVSPADLNVEDAAHILARRRGLDPGDAVKTILPGLMTLVKKS